MPISEPGAGRGDRMTGGRRRRRNQTRGLRRRHRAGARRQQPPVVVRRGAVVRLARVRRRLLEDARVEVDAVLRRSRSSPSSRLRVAPPAAAAAARNRVLYVNGQPVSAVAPAARPRRHVGRGAGRGLRRRLGDDGRVDDVRAVPARAGRERPGALVDPIFGRPVAFYLFTLPAWQLMATWLTTISLVIFVAPRCSCWC